MKNILKILKIDAYSATPKYLQLVNNFASAVESGLLQTGEVLPSINDLSCSLEISRNTIERVYSELKKLGIVGSVPGKGIFIQNTDVKKRFKILLLFNKLSSHKKILYDSLVERLGDHAAIDFYIYNNDFNLFKKILARKSDYPYAKYIVVPHFTDNEDKAVKIINEIPKEKLILVDKSLPEVTGRYAVIYQDFEKDIYGALSELTDKLSRYERIKIIFPTNTYHSAGILKGFKSYCKDNSFVYEVINCMEREEVIPGTAYINLMEEDLVNLIIKILDLKLEIGKEVGLISYNETPIKKFILNGLTTISTDFELLGVRTAEAAIYNHRALFAVPFKVSIRNSL